MVAPYAWGGHGIGQFMAAADGTVITGSPYVDTVDPISGIGLQHGGIAGVASLLPVSSSVNCIETGRSVCSSSSSGTTPCPCGASTEPGRGCPNSVGEGARLYCHGGFNQVTVARVLLDGLPPRATTLVVAGTPSLLPRPGIVAGSGVSCLGAPLVWSIERADDLGHLMLDDFEIPPALLQGMFGYSIPIQALYRDADICAGPWNASNAVVFSLSWP
jgi:hypothetical protein